MCGILSFQKYLNKGIIVRDCVQECKSGGKKNHLYKLLSLNNVKFLLKDFFNCLF